MNYYDELEVSTKASTDVIKAAYKAQAKKYHPDIYKGDPRFSSEKLKNLNCAYEVLTNSNKREEYDYLNKINENTHNTNTSEPQNTHSDSYDTTRSKSNDNFSQSKKSNVENDKDLDNFLKNVFIVILIVIFFVIPIIVGLSNQ